MPAQLKTADDLPAANARLAADMAKALGTRADGLDQAIKRAKGKLPARLLAELADLHAAEALLGHPHLRHRVDLDAARRLHGRTRTALDKLDLKRDRERYWLGVLTGLAVNLALLAAAILAFMAWRGLI